MFPGHGYVHRQRRASVESVAGWRQRPRGRPIEEMRDELRQVVDPVTERGHHEADALETVEEVRAELALGGEALQVLVRAAMMRTSAPMDRVPPTRSNCRSWSTRRILDCMASGMSPISSRKSVPSRASSKRPGRHGWLP